MLSLYYAGATNTVRPCWATTVAIEPGRCAHRVCQGCDCRKVCNQVVKGQLAGTLELAYLWAGRVIREVEADPMLRVTRQLTRGQSSQQYWL